MFKFVFNSFKYSLRKININQSQVSISLFKLNNSYFYSFKTMESLRLNAKEDTLKFLKEEKVEFHVVDHEKIETTKEAETKLKSDKHKTEEYIFTKNLFFKNKAGGYYFLVAHPVNLF